MKLWFPIVATFLLAGPAESAILRLENAEDGSSSMELKPGESKQLNIVLDLHSIDTGFAFANVFLDDDDNETDGATDVTELTEGLTGPPEEMIVYDRSAFTLPAEISWNINNEYGLIMGRQDGLNWLPGEPFVIDTLTITHNGEAADDAIPVVFEAFPFGVRPPQIVTAEFTEMPWNLGLAGILPNFVDPGVGAEDNPFIIILVDPCGGNEGIRNLTQSIDYPTIQCALDDAEDGDEIEVDPGTYIENLDFLDKDITLRSTDPLDADVVKATIIDGGGFTTVVTISAGVISGFTITGGAQSGDNAGGVHATGTAVVSHNIITGNSADRNGGGVIARDTALVHNNRIVANSAAELGGGVSARDDSLIINNYIALNSAQFGGGGLRTRETPIIRNNTFVFNSSADAGPVALGGGGILASNSPLILSNVIAFSTDGVGFHSTAGDNAVADYNCVFGNFDGDYSEEAIPGPNDLNVDPQLDDDELHLTNDSPCVNAGDPDLDPLEGETDIDHEDRIQSARVDIGCDEAVCEGDANGDGTVDPLDSGFVLARFGCVYPDDGENCLRADVNGDGVVDPLDSGFVLARFGDCS